MWVLLATSVNTIQDVTISQRQEERNYAQLLRMLTGRALTKHLCKTTGWQEYAAV
jgi:hypothetical protein